MNNILNRLEDLKSIELSNEEARNRIAEEYFNRFAQEYYNHQYRRLVSSFLHEFGGWRKVLTLEKQLRDKTIYADKLEKFTIEREMRISELKQKIAGSL